MTDSGNSTAVLGVHVEDEWETPEGYQKNIRQFLQETDYDNFLYASAPNKEDRRYEEMADREFETDGWGQFENQEDIDWILDNHDTIYHIGLRWGACHAAAFRDQVSEIYSSQDKSHEYVFPSHCITDTDELLSQKLAKPQFNIPLTRKSIGLPWREAFKDPEEVRDFEMYTEPLPEEDKDSYSLEIQKGSPTIRWELDPSHI